MYSVDRKRKFAIVYSLSEKNQNFHHETHETHEKREAKNRVISLIPGWASSNIEHFSKSLIRNGISWFILIMVLSSCAQIPSSESVTPTAKFPVELPFTPTLTVSIPTAYPILTNTSTAVPVATVPSKRLYTDPGNWYSLSIPIEWKATNNPNAFSGNNGFFETGYLPEMAFMPHEMNVCQWLANIDSQATYSISFMESNRCILTSLPGILPAAIHVIIKNPAADDDQRFFYVKTDPDHYFEILGSFAWLRSTNLLTPPASRPATLRPADASFWEKAAPMPPGFSVEEHKLPQEAQNKNPSQNIFPRSIPSLPPQEKPNVDLIVSNTWEDASQQMKPFGYELEPASLAHLWQLYKNGELLLDNLYNWPIIYRVSTPSGEKIAFLMHAIKDPNQPLYAPHNAAGYLIWNDAIILWEEAPRNFIDPGLLPILYQGDLLWLQAEPNTILLHVKNSQRDTLFTMDSFSRSITRRWRMVCVAVLCPITRRVIKIPFSFWANAMGFGTM